MKDILKIWKKDKEQTSPAEPQQISAAEVVEQVRDGSRVDGQTVAKIVDALMDYDKLPLLSDLTQQQINEITVMLVKNKHFYGGCEVIEDYVPLMMALQVSLEGNGRRGLIDLAKWSQVDPQHAGSRWRGLFQNGK